MKFTDKTGYTFDRGAGKGIFNINDTHVRMKYMTFVPVDREFFTEKSEEV